MTLADGSFVVERLRPQRYTLFTGSSLGEFAVRAGVRPGKEEVELRLAPGGRVLFQVKDATGAAVEGAKVRLLAVGGSPVCCVHGVFSTDAEGAVEMPLPAGAVEVEVSKDELKLRLPLRVGVGEGPAVEVILR